MDGEPAALLLLDKLGLGDGHARIDADAGDVALALPGSCDCDASDALAAPLAVAERRADATAGALAHEVLEKDDAPLTDGDALSLAAAGAVLDGVLGALTRGEADALTATLPLPHGDEEREVLAQDEPAGDSESVAHTVAQGVAVADARGELDADGDLLTERLACGEGDADAVTDSRADGV